MKLKLTFTRAFALVLVAIAFPFLSNAQSITSGKVISSEDNSELTGVTIKVLNGNKFATTDEKGTYRIEAKSGEVLEFSYIGFASRQVTVNSALLVDVILSPDNKFLSDVVVTALGFKKERASLGYAIQEVKGENLIKAREQNPISSLTGKIAGLTVGASPELLGAPGVLLRGKSPLYVVDGIPINSDTWNISPDDIETITVLKGPTASALYGSRGQFGAIQINTKRGTMNKRGFQVDLTSSTMIDNGFIAIPKVQDLYGPGDHGKYAFVDGKGGGTNDGDYDVWGPRFDGQLIPQFDSPIDPNTGVRQSTPWVARGKDNLSRFIRPGILQNTNLAISAKNDKGDFRVSGSHGHQRGLVPNTWLNTYNLNTTAGYNLSSKLRVETNININRQVTDNIPDVTYGPNSLIYNVATWAGADWDVDAFNPNKGGSYWQPGKEGVQQIYAEYQRYNNPWFSAYEWLRGHYKTDIYGYVSAKYSITDYLSLQLRSQVTAYDLMRNEKMPYSAGAYGRDERKGDYREDKRSLFENNNDLLLTFDKNLSKDFSLRASVGGNMRSLSYNSSFVTTDYLNVPGLYTFSNSLNPIRSANYSAKMAVNSAYGFVDLGYKTWAYLSLTGRYDKSSALLPKNNAFFYPSAALSVLPTEFLNLGPITFMKIRGSYANVGSSFTEDNIGPASNFLGYGANYTTPYGGPNYLQPTYSILNSLYSNQSGASFTRTLVDPNLKPSFSSSYEIGTDIKVLKNRLGFDFTYFNSIDGPGIFDLPISDAAGPAVFRTNGIKTERKGIELAILGNPIHTKSFDWNITANYGSFKEYLKEIYPNDLNVTSINRFIKIGDRTDAYYGSAFARDQSGNVIYGSDGLPLRSSQPQFLGYKNPNWTWGVYNSFTYKGVTLGVQFDGRVGGKIWNYIERQTYRGGRNIATVEGAMGEARYNDTQGIKSWIGEGVKIANGASPKFDADGNITNYSELQFAPNTNKTFVQDWISRYYGTDEGVMVDRTFAKLREVTLGYAFPAKWFDNNKYINAVSLTLTGRNLFYFSKVKDVDLDQYVGLPSYTTSGLSSGAQSGFQTPTMRRYGVNLKVTF
ncbi:MAG: SusC/RagA family TonB-linked outer membrane protein [Saprospiraceae bacterium]